MNTTQAKPRQQSVLCGHGIRNDPFLVSFAQNPNGPLSQIEIARLQATEFANAKTGSIEQLNDGTISTVQVEPSLAVSPALTGLVSQGGGILWTQGPRQSLRLLGVFKTSS